MNRRNFILLITSSTILLTVGFNNLRKNKHKKIKNKNPMVYFNSNNFKQKNSLYEQYVLYYYQL